MINLQHHRHDFNISASWTFSASGHGKGSRDGIGGVVKAPPPQKSIFVQESPNELKFIGYVGGIM